MPEFAYLWIVLGTTALAAIILLAFTFFLVQQRTEAIVQRFGKFVRQAGPGLNAKIPFIDRVVARVNLRVQQLDVTVETKTSDNVFVQMVVAVQFYILPEKVYDAHYKLDDARRQITSYVFDVVRAQVPKIKLDDVFEKKDEIADIVKSELEQVMEGFGYGILKALVTDIDPDAKVKQSMAEINAAQRMRVAATAMMLGVCSMGLMSSGCAVWRGPAPESPRRMGGAEIGQPVTSAELDELTRAFADRYVGLLFSVCGALKEDNPGPAQRRAAQVLLADNATNVYDIASNGDAFTRLLDLVVVTTLVSQVWDDDGRAVAVFGERGRTLAEALSRARAEARTLAARVLTADQLNVLDALLSHWREENPEVVRASFVRFSNFAIGRGRSAASEVLEARGLFAGVGEAGQAVDEARLLSERMFYWLKRAPTLARWQAGAMKDDLAATPELGTALAALTQLTDQIEQLPANIAAERRATLAGLEDTLRDVDATITNGRTALEEARFLVTSLEPAAESLGGVIGTTDALFTRFDTWDRWRAETQSAPFEIREHTEAIRELAVTADKVNEMLRTSDSLLSSPAWDRRIHAVNESADGRIAVAADQSRLVLDAFFWRGCALLGVLFVMLILYRLLSLTLMRKLRSREDAASLAVSGETRPG